MKSVVVAHENSDGIQALYVDGILRESDEAICVSMILKHVTIDEPITLRQINYDLPEYIDWPETLAELDATQYSIGHDG